MKRVVENTFCKFIKEIESHQQRRMNIVAHNVYKHSNIILYDRYLPVHFSS